MGGLAPKMVDHARSRWRSARCGLAGVPPLAGFFSKDEILARRVRERPPVIWALLLLGAFLTAFYTFRLLFLAFFSGRRGCRKEVAHHVHESPAGDDAAAGRPGAAHVRDRLGGRACPSAHGTRFERFLAPVFPGRRRPGERRSLTLVAGACSAWCRRRRHRRWPGSAT